MEFADLFRDYWWLMFPIFGMLMAVWGMISHERRLHSVMGLIKSYVDQGKDPPPELLGMASQGMDGHADGHAPHGQSGAWTFIVFAAISAGFATGYYHIREESFAFAFLIVAVVMGIMAVGALLMLMFSRKT